MCNVVSCKSCGKYTWSGCGEHLNQIFRNYNPNDLGKCDHSPLV